MISFEQEVEVTKSSWNIDARTLLSKIGGFIGISKNFLWLVDIIIDVINYSPHLTFKDPINLEFVIFCVV